MRFKVRFDHQIFSLQRFGGISRYFAGLSHGLKKSKDINHQLNLLYSENAYLLPAEVFPGRAILKKLLKLNDKRRIYKWNNRIETRLIAKNNFDLFHPTYYDPYYLDLVKKPVVITIHDMIHERFPQFFLKGDDTIYRKRSVAARADRIIAISENTKKDIIEYLHIPEQKISVVHHGLFIEPFVNTYQFYENHLPSGIPDNFLLFVGGRETYKNFIPFVKAIAPLLKKEQNLHLFCAGGGMFTSSEKSMFSIYGITNNLLQADLTDRQLAEAYRHALAFVFPSLYEGFGLPILEAFSNGCAVALSHTSCFPEIGGNAVAYFDPYQREDMASVVLKLIEDADYRLELIQAGRKRLASFSAQDCIEHTIGVYKKI